MLHFSALPHFIDWHGFGFYRGIFFGGVLNALRAADRFCPCRRC